MENETLATEVIKEVQGRLNSVVLELDHMDVDFDKVIFALVEITETIDLKAVETTADAYYMRKSLEKVDTLTGIAFDYITGLQSQISDIVARERRYKDGVSD